jgi:hypothetical protein
MTFPLGCGLRFVQICIVACVLASQRTSTGQEVTPQPQLPTASLNAIYVSTPEAIVVPECDLTITKSADDMHLEAIREFRRGGFQLAFEHRAAPVRASVTIYRAPDATSGPSVLLDASGAAIPDDDRSNPYAVSKLSPPSESFEDEFRLMVQNVEQVSGMRCINQQGKPARKLAWPKDLKNSPVAYVAFFERMAKDGDPKDPALDECQESRLYFVKGHFVKIHVSGPKCQEVLDAPVSVAAAVWGEPTDRAP